MNIGVNNMYLKVYNNISYKKFWSSIKTVLSDNVKNSFYHLTMNITVQTEYHSTLKLYKIKIKIITDTSIDYSYYLEDQKYIVLNFLLFTI